MSVQADLPQSEIQNPKSKIAWIDAYRGIGIIAVVIIHVMPRLLRDYTEGSKTWYALFSFHRAAFFAVPAFILLSTLVNTGSLRRNSDLKRYTINRLQTVLWPYLVWSTLYIAYQRWGTASGFSIKAIPQALLYGKAWPHLYFLVVLIQLLALLPLLVRIFRKPPPGWAFGLLTIILTLAAYGANRYYFRFTYVASQVFWYIPPVMLGLWLGLLGKEAGGFLRRSLLPASVCTLAGIAIYFPLAADNTRHIPVNTFVYQLAEWFYTTSVGLLLLSVCERLAEQGTASRFLALLGRYSLQIYLAHPFLLIWMDGRRDTLNALGTGGLFLILMLVSILIPLLLAEILQRLRISPLLFGR